MLEEAYYTIGRLDRNYTIGRLKDNNTIYTQGLTLIYMSTVHYTSVQQIHFNVI